MEIYDGKRKPTPEDFVHPTVGEAAAFAFAKEKSMPASETLPATDSANDLRRILGDDATATFEDDPNFVESNPTGTASSENVEEQRATASSSPAARDTDDAEEEDDDEDAEDDDDDVDEDEDLDDEEDDDEDDLDDESEEDDDLDDDDDDEDDEDDADEVKASSVLRADGLLGYEDEADDVKNGVDRETGDAKRAEAEEDLHDGEKNYDPNSHEDGKWEPLERDDTPEAAGAILEDRNDDPDFIPPYKASFAQIWA